MKENYLPQAEGNSEIINWINHNLKNYLKTNPEVISEIEHIIDYLKSNAAPKRLKKMSYVEAKNNSKKWVSALTKKGKLTSETEEDVETVLELDKDFKVVKLLSKNAFNREGFLMSHCVSSYFSKKDSTDVLSLRDKNNIPHATLEIKKGASDFNQVVGKGNGEIHPKYINYIIQTMNSLGINIRARHMPNLGYIAISQNTFNILKKEIPNIKYLDFDGATFIYKHQKV